MEVELTFTPVVSIEYGEMVPVNVSEVTERIAEIIAEAVYPYPITSLMASGGNIVVRVIVNGQDDALELLDNASYYLPDEQAFALGISIPANVSGIGQDTWGEGDLALDDQSLSLLGIPVDGLVNFIPILTSYRYVPNNISSRTRSRYQPIRSRRVNPNLLESEIYTNPYIYY